MAYLFENCPEDKYKSNVRYLDASTLGMINQIISSDKFLSWATTSPEWFLESVHNALSKQDKRIVGITGLAGSGKDSALKFMQICPVLSDLYRQIAFAEPLKEIARIVGFTSNQLTDRTLKEATDSFWGISPRQFLQMCGTEMFRNVWRQDCWVEMARLKIRNMRNFEHDNRMVFITDVRFPNEAQMIKDEGGVIVKILRPSVDIGSTHASEAQIKDIAADLIIENDAPNARAWSVKFTYNLVKFLKSDAFYYDTQEK